VRVEKDDVARRNQWRKQSRETEALHDSVVGGISIHVIGESKMGSRHRQ
jgi:hypothetical protein